MSITAIDIVQSNVTNDSNLMSVHSPLVFIVNATFTGSPPELLYCSVFNSDAEVLGLFKCIPYQDILSTIRQFIFVADSILRGFMEDFNDFVQSSGSIEYCDGITKEFTLKFWEPMYFDVELDIVALHCVRQFGDDPNAENIFENEAQTYIGIENKPVYLYFYNDDTSNIISTDPGLPESILLDYDDVEFADLDDELLTAITS